MLDLFSIFSKGGIVLWCFQSTSEIFTPSVNALIRNVILQERSGNNTFSHNALSLQYKLDNEFELVFVVAYQRILQLSYVDKFLNDVHLEFRDKYKNELEGGRYIMDFDFKTSFDNILKQCELWAKSQAKLPKQMRTFEDSQKSKKTVASMIERKGEEKSKKSGLVGSKALTEESMRPVLDKLRDHLIGKNVAADIANKLCDSVSVKLDGKVLGTFDSVAKTVRATLTEALVQILSPKRRVDILRDCLHAKQQSQPYVMAFCGVNGVGKSTNLAKICFWLIENKLSVLIAACDTFRAGAVEQLRTHVRRLDAMHPSMVHLYEKGYGKDAAGIAMEAIKFAADSNIDVVLIDTAGRMQDNEPLMRALAKLIKVNEPDLVLFVGEALVGNEAVDQLVKFNQALADHSSTSNPHVIDGIVLTKFDTIDDKVGAAISMTYITGQPIVFVGTGQTYTDLKALNANAVVHALMK
ncbi:jg19588 [Pararge aegeria aegeria]|uniref:Jg19588 protein n=1 Tax=Pararge aegeria aegeria TaxID=348720 RepID=A0A8S4R6Y5_9NEOP|nr:jg19588 [Pararge aegeria aegeria]